MRRALWLPFASLLLVVIAILLGASFAGTRRLAQSQADSLMAGATREAEVRLHRIFDSIRHKVLEDYASIRSGRYSSRQPEVLKDRLLPNLFALPGVDSLMIGDLSGSQFLLMRYTPAARAAPVLASVADRLPAAPTGHALQFFTRDFRPAEWGENSHWTLWDEEGRNALQSWELPLPGYDGRLRPWHQAAMARFSDLSLDKAQTTGPSLIAWTDVYPLFTTKKPGISASIAGRDPEGRILVVAYDLLLDEIAQFSTKASPTAQGQLFVLTEDGRMLGQPKDTRTDAALRRKASVLAAAGSSGYVEADEAVGAWRKQHGGRAGHFRCGIGGQPWWAGFAPFEIGPGRTLWVGVLLPEADLVPAAASHQRMVLAVGAIALLLAIALAAFIAHRLSAPLTSLASQARRIAALDLGPAPAIRSPITEVAQLADTLAETRESLRQRIAEREKALGALAAGEQRLRTLAENTPDIVVRYDRALRHLFINPAHTLATGIPAEQVLGRSIAEVGFPADLVATWSRVLNEVFDTGRPGRMEFAYATPAGQRFFDARLTHEAAPTAGADTVLTVVRDISERVHAAAALLHSQTRYRTLVDSALVGIIVHQDGIIRFANPAALLLFGHDGVANLIDNVRWVDYVDPAVREELIARAEAALRGEDPPLHPGWQLHRPDGTARWVQSNATAIEWDGRPALLTFIRDITELRAANERQTALEEQLRHAQKLEAVGLLAGGIAHDFNNLLQVIGGNAQLAEMSDSAPAEREDALHEISKTVQRAAQMTRQLLAFSRRQALSREETELNTFVAEHVQMLRRLIPENIRLAIQSSAEPIIVSVDRGQLGQVVLNLCLNSRDAMPKGGQLTLRLSSAPLDAGSATRFGRPAGSLFARLTVTDTGAGMDRPTLDRIFDPFFTTKPRDKGTGLGLAVVYGIVHQHEGRIEVVSEPGAGAEFSVYLPQLAGRSPAIPHEPAPAAPPVRHGGTILLAEDNDPIRRIAVAALQHAGYVVVAVKDGREAVEKFREANGTIDLLFFDVMMPGLGGFEAAQHCRALNPEIPVVFASGYAAESVAEGESIPTGAHVLQKPYRTEALLELLGRLMAKRHG